MDENTSDHKTVQADRTQDRIELIEESHVGEPPDDTAWETFSIALVDESSCLGECPDETAESDTTWPCGCGDYHVTLPPGDLPDALDVVCPKCQNHFGFDSRPDDSTGGPVEYQYCGLCGESLEGAIDVETGVCADCTADSLAVDGTFNDDPIEVSKASDANDRDTNDESPTSPDYYKQTAVAYGHGVTAIKGRIQNLVWRCRTCNTSRKTLAAFQEVECDG